MTSTPEPDERLIGAHDVALAALQEITPAATIGPAAGYLLEEDGSVSLRFENRLPGYPGWYWTVTVARVEDAEPTVLEVELLPNEGALLAPEWVPWAERLAEYRAHQAELAEQAAAAEEESGEGADADSDDSDEDESDDDDLDEDDDADEPDILHAGDLDGVDIDELDDSAIDDEDADDDSDEGVDEEESDEDESEGDDSDESEGDDSDDSDGDAEEE